MWTISVVTCFEANDSSERTFLRELSNGLKVAVIAAVLVYREQPAGFLGNLHQRNGFFESRCERLIHNDIAARLKALACERIVGFVRRSDDHESDFFHRQQFVQAAHDSNIRIFFRCLVAGSLQDGGKMQSRHGANYRCMKRSASEPEPDKTDFNHGEPVTPPKRTLKSIELSNGEQGFLRM